MRQVPPLFDMFRKASRTGDRRGFLIRKAVHSPPWKGDRAGQKVVLLHFKRTQLILRQKYIPTFGRNSAQSKLKGYGVIVTLTDVQLRNRIEYYTLYCGNTIHFKVE